MQGPLVSNGWAREGGGGEAWLAENQGAPWIDERGAAGAREIAVPTDT